MNKPDSSSNIISLFIIAVIEYTMFALNSISIISFICIPILTTVLVTANSKKSYYLRLISAFVLSLISAFAAGYSLNIHDMCEAGVIFIQLHIPAVAIAYCINNHNFDFKTSVIYASGANVIALIANLAVVKYVHNVDMTKLIGDEIDAMSDMYKTLMSTANLSGTLDAETFDNMFKLVKSAVVMLMPAILILSCVVIAFVVFKITCTIIDNFTKIRVGYVSKLRYFIINSKLSFITFLLLIISSVSGNSYFTGAVYNFAMIAAFAYVADGIALVDFLLAKNIKNKIIHKIAIILIVILSILSGAVLSGVNGLTVLFFVGLLDAGRDFRKLRKLIN